MHPIASSTAASAARSGSNIVDAHVHVGQWAHADFLGRATSLAESAAVLETAGVSGAGVVPTDLCDNEGLLAEAKVYLGGGGSLDLWMFAWARATAGTDLDPTVPPGRADLDWIESHRADLCGIKIHPSLSRHRISDPAFASALELAAAKDLAILVHCGRWQEKASYRFAVDAAARFPTVRFVLAHAGGDTPPLATAAAALVAERGVDNVWFEFSGVREYWVIERNIALLGADRYLMGSDHNLAHPSMYIGAVNGMALSESDRALVLGGNARRVYGERMVP